MHIDNSSKISSLKPGTEIKFELKENSGVGHYVLPESAAVEDDKAR